MQKHAHMEYAFGCDVSSLVEYFYDFKCAKINKLMMIHHDRYYRKLFKPEFLSDYFKYWVFFNVAKPIFNSIYGDECLLDGLLYRRLRGPNMVIIRNNSRNIYHLLLPLVFHGAFNVDEAFEMEITI